MNVVTAKAITALILSALVWAFGYGAFAFMCWEANPGNWDMGARGLMALLCTLLSFVVFGATASL